MSVSAWGLYWAIVLAACAGGIAGDVGNGLAITSVTLITAGLFWMAVDHLRADRGLRTTLLLLFASRLVATVVIYFVSWWPELRTQFVADFAGYDALRFDLFGWRLAQSGFSPLVATSIPLNQLGMVSMVAALYAIFGHALFIVAVMNTFLSSLAAVETFAIARRLLPQHQAAAASVAVLLVPEVVYYGAIPMKEALITWLLVLAVRSWADFQFDGRLRRAIVAGLALIALFDLRFVVGIALLGSFIVIGAFGPGRKRYRFLVGPTAAVTAVVAALTLLPSAVLDLVRSLILSGNVTDIFSLAQIGESASFTGTEGNSISVLTAGTLSLDRFYVLPLRMALQFAIPLPFTWVTEGGYLLMHLSGIFVVLTLPLAVVGSLRFLRDARGLIQWCPLLFTVALVAGSSPILDPRLRVSVIPLYVIAILRGANPIPLVLVTYPLVLTLAALLYVLVKSLVA